VLAVQAANTGTNDSVALQAIQDEIEASIQEISRIGNDTQFATRRLLNGDNANGATVTGGVGLGVSVTADPTNSTLSSGLHFLQVTQTDAGSITFGAGVDGINNSGATTLTGSTFDTGTYDLVLSNVRAAAARVVRADFHLEIAGAPPAAPTDLNNAGDFINDTTGGTFAIDTDDEITFSGLASDGTAYTTTITSLGGGLSATGIETAVQTALTAAGAGDTIAYNATTGTFSLTAGTVGQSVLSVGVTIDDEGLGAPDEFNAGEVVSTAGNLNDGILVVGNGPAQTIVAGQTVTVFGPEPTDPRESQPQVTFTFGATITEGVDQLVITQQAYTGSLDGGQLLAFQNGDFNIRFRTGIGGGFPSGETVKLDFGAIIDLGGGPNRTFTLSAVNNALGFQIGPSAGQNVRIEFGDLRASNLGFTDETQPNGNARVVSEINVLTLTGAEEALRIVDESLRQVNTQRSALGAFANRLEATIANLGVAAENLTASESRIRDADIAIETTRFTRNQILVQSGISILGQANLIPQAVLSLLQ